MIPENFLYFSANLLEESKIILNNYLDYNLKFNRDNVSNMYLHHCTLLHKNDKEISLEIKEKLYELLKNKLNNEKEKIYTLKIIGIGANNKALAFKVDTFDFPFPRHFKHTYHITVCTYGNGKPYESNLIEEWIDLENPIEVKCILKENLIKE